MACSWRTLPTFIGLALVACTKPAPTRATVERPTLCQLADAREGYAGRTLTVEGYLLVSTHGTLINDPRCGKGVAIRWHRAGEPGMRALTDLANQMGLDPWMVRVRVTGEMRKELSQPAGRGWQLWLSAADVLSARPVP